MKLKGKRKVKVTWAIALRIWWSFSWRSVLWGIPPGLCMAILAALIGKIFDLNVGMIGLITLVIVWILVGIFVFKRILINNYRTFQILLIADDENIPWKREEDTEAGEKIKEG